MPAAGVNVPLRLGSVRQLVGVQWPTAMGTVIGSNYGRMAVLWRPTYFGFVYTDLLLRECRAGLGQRKGELVCGKCSLLPESLGQPLAVIAQSKKVANRDRSQDQDQDRNHSGGNQVQLWLLLTPAAISRAAINRHLANTDTDTDTDTDTGSKNFSIAHSLSLLDR